MRKEEFVASKLNLAQAKVKAALSLFQEGGTVPFVARYRREATGGLEERELRAIEALGAKFDALQERKATVLKTIEALGKLTPELRARVESCQEMAELEDLYRPYKPKRETRGSKALKAGLEPLTDFILTSPVGDLTEYAKRFVCKEYPTVEKAVSGAMDILAERVSDKESYRRYIKGIALQKGFFEIQKNEDSEVLTYDNYAGLRLPVRSIRGYQVLAITRGEKEKVLKKHLSLPRLEILSHIQSIEKSRPCRYGHLVDEAVEDSFDRLILPSVTNDVWSGLWDVAKEEALQVFAKNLRDILLFPPLMGKVILGFDPGYAHGCKLAVISPSGDVLDTAVVYPTLGEGKRKEEAKAIVKRLIEKDGVEAIALGNGTASRESQEFLRSLLEENGLDDVSVVMVSEAGASVYSATPLAEREFPQYDVNLRSSVSIARRLEDPLAELVKIPPESVGVGQYQHDMDQKDLRENLAKVVEDCVNYVGVNLNTASESLLSYVAGVSPKLAGELVKHRMRKGPFRSRAELSSVKGFGPVAFKNAAGFLRIAGEEPFDGTGIHPESYQAARKIATAFDLSSPEKAQRFLTEKPDFEKVAQEGGTDPYTAKMVVEELSKPGRDPRGSFQTARLSKRITKIEDLEEGMVLEGTVRNVAEFGAFVDLGIHKDGLVHISEVSERRIGRMSDALSVGQVVKVYVLGVDLKRQRISLSLKRATGKGLTS